MKIKLGQALEYEQPTKYIVSSEKYNDEYLTPVLTAGKSFILGYTNEEDGIYNNLPVIIFDDFTTEIKYVDFPFKVKSSAMKMLRPSNNEYNLKYFYYLINFLNFQPTSHKRHWISKFSELEFDIPERVKQDQIVEKLDKLVEMQSKKTTQLKKYDDLVKSQFIEMFGDSKTTESVRLKDIAQIITGSTPSMAVKDYYKSKDIRFYKPSDLINDINNLKDSDYWISEEARTVARIVPPNSILVSCIGTVGKIGITNTESTCNQQINAILPNKKFNHIYLAYNIATIKEKLQHIAKAPVVPIINKTTFGNIEIKFETNIELQNQFADFVKHIDKLKFTIKQSIEKLELCYKSLMKQYFD